MKIIARTRLLPAPFEGTLLGIRLEGGTHYEIAALALSGGSPSVEIEWGDGSKERVGTFPAKHDYPAEGDYQIRISDDIEEIKVSGVDSSDFAKLYAPCLRSFRTSAAKLVTIKAVCFNACSNLAEVDVADGNVRFLQKNGFCNCTSLPERMYFPRMESVTAASAGVAPFRGASTVREIHFPKSLEPELTRQQFYIDDPSLGSGSGVCIFDL